MLVLPNDLSWLSVARLNSHSLPTEQQIFWRWLNTALKGLGFEGSKFLDRFFSLLNIIEGNVVLEDVFLCIILVKYQLLIGLIYFFLKFSDFGR